MGAEHCAHLMSDVNVLIVGDRDTDKYRYCVKHRLDIVFFSPRAVFDAYDKWILGQDVTVDQYKMPIFDSLNVCISRLDSSAKDSVTKSLVQNGGQVTDSLTINNSCVVLTTPLGKRYSKLLEWGVPVVHPKWVFDSVRRGMALLYSYYEISTTQEWDQIGLDSCDCWDLLLKSSKRPSTDPEKTVKLARLESKLWSNIMDSVKPASSTQLNRDTTWDPQKPQETTPEKVKTASEPLPAQVSRLFANHHFKVRGFDSIKTSKLSKVIQSHGGEITDDNLEPNSYLVVPSDSVFVPDLSTEGYEIVTEWFIERSLHYNQIKLDNWGRPLLRSNLKLDLQILISGFTGVELLHTINLIKLLGCQYCETLTSQRDLLLINLSTIGFTKENSPNLFNLEFSDFVNTEPTTHTSIGSTKNKINACKKWNIPVVSILFLIESLSLEARPDFRDSRWCIFAPKETETSTRTLNLPSPSKIKKKNWGRLIGKAQESQLSKKFLTDSLDQDLKLSTPSTQISYNDTETKHIDPKELRATRKKLRNLNQDL